MTKYRILHPRKYGGVPFNRFDVVDAGDLPAHAVGSLMRAGFIEPFDPPAPDIDRLPKSALLRLADEVGVDVPDGLKVNDIRTLLKEQVT